eukprot:5045226-Amphidinium_carterae.1
MWNSLRASTAKVGSCNNASDANRSAIGEASNAQSTMARLSLRAGVVSESAIPSACTAVRTTS